MSSNDSADGLGAQEVRRRAVAGAIAVGARGVAARVLGVIGFVVLARYLEPREFGVMAFGFTVITAISFFVNSGLGPALLRREEAPTARDLQNVVGFQLITLFACTFLIGIVSLNFGEAGRLTAAMIALYPITAWRTANVVVYERNLIYKPVVTLEIIEVTVFQVVAVCAVIAGAGVWGVVAGVAARALSGTVWAAWRGPVGLLRPRLEFATIRPMLRFSSGFQAVSVVNLIRDQGLNLGVAAIGGLAELGVWNLANRLLQVPFLLFRTLWRVSFPATSRLLAAGEEPRPIIERGISLVGIVAGAILVALVSATPSLIPGLLGEEWSGVEELVPPAALGLMIAGPISVAAAGFLYAAGNTGVALRGVVLHTAAWFAVTFPLLPLIGVSAIAYGWLLGNIVEALILGIATSRWTGARIIAPLRLPLLSFMLASAAGWTLAWRLGPTVPAAALGAVAGEVVFFSVVALFQRSLLIDTTRLVRKAWGGDYPVTKTL